MLEQDVLRDILKIVKRFKELVSYHFRLDSLGMTGVSKKVISLHCMLYIYRYRMGSIIFDVGAGCIKRYFKDSQAF